MKLHFKFVLILNLLAALCSLFAYISPFVDPHITGIFSFFGLGFPMMIICHLIFLVFWLFVKPKIMLLSGAILILGYVPFKKTVGLNNDVKDQSGLSVLSYNIGYTRRYLDGKNGQKKKRELINFIRKENPDVICLQERAHWHEDLYKEIFKGYKLYPDKKIGTGIFTKLPIVNKGNIAFDTKAHNATWVDVKYKNEVIRVYSIHLSSNKVKDFSDNIKEIWDQSLYILDKYNEHAKIRVDQIKEILTHAAKSPYPVIINGDFNDIPQSYIYKLISKDYCDAFLKKGSGMGKTFKTRLPGLRIDYSFLSEELCVNSHQILDEDLSDHYPILTNVSIKE